MERLTHQRVNGIKTGYWTTNKKDELTARLGKYEDTGLEPQEIMELKVLYQERCAELKEQQEKDVEKTAELQKKLSKMQPKTQKIEENDKQQDPAVEKTSVQTKKKKQDKPSGVPGPYKGFMHIKCPECGTVKNFCARKETETFYCDHCRAKVHLEDMAKVLLKCECGKVAVYYTNRYDEVFDIECVQCEAPVCVEWNRRAGRYTPVKDGGH